MDFFDLFYDSVQEESYLNLLIFARSTLLQGVEDPARRLQQSGVRIRAEDERKHPARRAGVRQIRKVPYHSENTDGEDDEERPRRGILKPVLSLRMKKKSESENDCDEEERNFIEKNHGESPPVFAPGSASHRRDACFFLLIISLATCIRCISGQARVEGVFFSPAQKTRER
jgi:hypothetical protein